MRLHTEATAEITAPANLNPPRRHRSYPRQIKRARHNSYKVRTAGYTGVRHAGPPTINLVNLKPLMSEPGRAPSQPTSLQPAA